MRAYNVMWARATVVQEIEDMLRAAPQRIQDIQKRFKRENDKVTPPK